MTKTVYSPIIEPYPKTPEEIALWVLKQRYSPLTQPELEKHLIEMIKKAF